MSFRPPVHSYLGLDSDHIVSYQLGYLVESCREANYTTSHSHIKQQIPSLIPEIYSPVQVYSNHPLVQPPLNSTPLHQNLLLPLISLLFASRTRASANLLALTLRLALRPRTPRTHTPRKPTRARPNTAAEISPHSPSPISEDRTGRFRSRRQSREGV